MFSFFLSVFLRIGRSPPLQRIGLFISPHEPPEGGVGYIECYLLRYDGKVFEVLRNRFVFSFFLSVFLRKCKKDVVSIYE